MQEHTLHLEAWLGRGITAGLLLGSRLRHPHLDGVGAGGGERVGLGEGSPGRLILGVRAEQSKAEQSRNNSRKVQTREVRFA